MITVHRDKQVAFQDFLIMLRILKILRFQRERERDKEGGREK